MMNMKQAILSVLTPVLAVSFAMAQSVDEGVKALYYEKNKTAKDILQQVVNKNAKDPKAIYWLGQAMLTKTNGEDIAGTRNLYQQALQNGVNDPLIWVGSGQVDILSGGDINAAKQKFEQAITASKGKNAEVLNAIGRANADGSSKQGDPAYGIEKGKLAAALDQKDPDIYINIGINYLKQGSDHGGDAVEAFNQAIARDPKYARAFYHIGLIYQSQDNKEAMNEWYGKAIVADPTYAPVYLSYFEYYKNKDVNAAKEFLDKYVANSDKSCDVDYFVGDYYFRAGKYQDAVNQANTMLAGSCSTYVRANLLKAYGQLRLGDSVGARTSLEKFYATAQANEIEGSDYELGGIVYSKFPGQEDSVAKYFSKAVAADTSKERRIGYLNSAADVMAKAGKYDEQYKYLISAIRLRGDKTTEADYYKLSKAATDAVSGEVMKTDSVRGMALYNTADSITKAYITDFSDKPQGYQFAVLAAKKADYDTSKGLFVQPIQATNRFLEKDLEANKKTIWNNDYFLLQYYASKNVNLDSALALTEHMLTVLPKGTPEGDYTAQTREALLNQKNPPAKKATAAPAKKTPAATARPKKK
jgi:hypothetical protein